jgi:elongation factor Ts
MNITTEMIKALREKTGAGIMDSKRALEETHGDMKQAEVWIAKKGLAKAESKADRETQQGAVVSYIHHDSMSGAIVMLLCETDFVARTDEFLKLAREIAMQVVSMQPADVPDLLKQEYVRDPSITIETLIKQISGKVGENIRLAQFSSLSVKH